ncbi:response regulator [Thalassoglobus sp. JC818]|uniref:response regulator n=1 Tax=Thalassoglobus sp. JC818 TaxID=3232136 RepID=UPI003458529C
MNLAKESKSDASPQLLVADDDCAFRETVLELLEPHFQTIAVECAEHAIEVVSTTSIDVVILDMHMHVMTGLEAIRWLREHQSRLPCILMTSDLSRELEAEAYGLEAFSVLRKPPRAQHLIDTINCALEL